MWPLVVGTRAVVGVWAYHPALASWGAGSFAICLDHGQRHLEDGWAGGLEVETSGLSKPSTVVHGNSRMLGNCSLVDAPQGVSAGAARAASLVAGGGGHDAFVTEH